MEIGDLASRIREGILLQITEVLCESAKIRQLLKTCRQMCTENGLKVGKSVISREEIEKTCTQIEAVCREKVAEAISRGESEEDDYYKRLTESPRFQELSKDYQDVPIEEGLSPYGVFCRLRFSQIYLYLLFREVPEAVETIEEYLYNTDGKPPSSGQGSEVAVLKWLEGLGREVCVKIGFFFSDPKVRKVLERAQHNIQNVLDGELGERLKDWKRMGCLTAVLRQAVTADNHAQDKVHKTALGVLESLHNFSAMLKV